MNRDNIEYIKQWFSRIFAVHFTLSFIVLSVVAVKERHYFFAGIFVLLLIVLVLVYIRDEIAYTRWKNEKVEEEK